MSVWEETVSGLELVVSNPARKTCLAALLSVDHGFTTLHLPGAGHPSVEEAQPATSVGRVGN